LFYKTTTTLKASF